MRIDCDRWIAAAAAVAIAVAAAAGPVAAQPSQTAAAATAAFDKGRALMKAGKYAEACAAFETSERLEPAFGTLYNLAGCYVEIGKLATAWAAYRELAQRDTNAARRDDAKAKAEQLGPRVPRLVVTPPADRPDGLVVTVDGVDVTAGLGTDQPIDLGAHEVAATAPGFRPWHVATTVTAEARTVTVAIELVRAPTPPAPPTETPAGHSSRGTYAVIAIAGGGLLLGTGLVFGGLARSKWNDAKALCGADLVCDTDGDRERGDQLVHDARVRAGISTGVIIGGAVAVAAGVTLWLTRPHRARSVAIGAGPAPIGLSVVGSF